MAMFITMAMFNTNELEREVNKPPWSWFNWKPLYDRYVREAPPGATLVEVGVFAGESLAYLGVQARIARKGLRVIGVDWGRGCDLEDGTPSGPTTDHALAVLVQQQLADSVPMIVAPSTLAATLFADESVWMVYLDGCHESWAVQGDIWAWWPKIQKGGILAGHDYDWESVKTIVAKEFPSAKATPEVAVCWETYK